MYSFGIPDDVGGQNGDSFQSCSECGDHYLNTRYYQDRATTTYKKGVDYGKLTPLTTEYYLLKDCYVKGDDNPNFACVVHKGEKSPNEKDLLKKQKLLKNFEDLIDYYQKNLIKQITYHPRNNANQQLAIETNAGAINNTSITELPTEIQPVITSYFVDNNNTSLSQRELSSMISELQRELKNENKPTNYLPYILGTVGIVALIGIIGYSLFKKSKKE
jgi:hypothetical protein